jgi:hypothetical protein
VSLSGDCDGPLLEFVALREEILDRVRGQQQLFTLQLTVSAMIFGFALSRPGLTAVMLIVPFSSYLLCGRLVAQHFGTARVAEYIMDHLSARVPGGLHWEAWLRSKPTKPHALGSLLPHLFTFTGAGVLALVSTIGFVFGAHGTGTATRVGLIAVWGLGLAATGLTTILVLQMTGRAPIRSWTQAGLF